MTALRPVLVIQRRMTHYRVPFFERLRKEMPNHGCELLLAYGDPTRAEALRNDGADIDWAQRLRTIYFMGGWLCFQPFVHLLRGVSAVVITPENKLVNNLGVQLFQRECKIVLWGHGANLQSRRDTWREAFKRRMARRADWWLGYTDMSRPLIARSGFPEERVSILNNAVDTLELASMRTRSTVERVAAMRARLKIVGTRVGVFVGSLHTDKRIPFLLQAAREIRRKVPEFELLILGDGPDGEMVRDFCAHQTWAHHAGALSGQDKVDALAACRLMLNPGLVGLGILDSFVCAVPILTTDCGLHSPEIAYLKNGVNGAMTVDSQADYVAEAVRLLTDDSALKALQRGCDESAATYTVEKMAVNFARGIAACLDAPPLPRDSIL